MIISSFRAATSEVLGYTFDEVLVRDWIGRPLLTMMGQHGVADPDGVMTVYRRHYKAAHNDLLKPFDGISELLQRLTGAGIRMGVVSSKKADYLQLGLEAHGLDRWVVVLDGADETELHKPAPDPLMLAARLIGADPADCVYVRDAVTDVQAGQAAGMDTIGVTWGASSRADLVAAAPTVVVDTTSELLDTLLRYP